MKMTEFRKWTDIESLSHVMRSRNQSHWMKEQGPVYYRAKTKLHGTNAAIRVTANGVFPQSRSQIISVEKDNAGFAIWLKSREQYFENLISDIKSLDEEIEVTIYGEWCGPGIQKNVAVNQIPQKTFAAFSLQFHHPKGENLEGSFHSDPAMIRSMSKHIADNDPSFKILPWEIEPHYVNFDDPNSLSEFAEKVNSMVAECEETDPWVLREYGINGPGEGFVFYANPSNGNPYLKGFMFKAKGEAHRVNKTKSAATINPEVLRSVGAFVDFAVTVPRLEQGLTEGVQGELDPKRTGDFLSWVMRDILKECTVELADSGLTWKQVVGACSKKARDWYLEKGKVL